MFRAIANVFKRAEPVAPPKRKKHKFNGMFSTDNIIGKGQREVTQYLEKMLTALMDEQPINKEIEAAAKAAAAGGTVAMDSIGQSKYRFNQTVVPNSLLYWYGSNSFIGFQMCAIMAQHWLIAKACVQPARDAVRNGYEITINDGTEIDPEIRDAIRKEDVRFKVNKNLIEFIQMGRVFGIRVCMFKVESSDPEYYKKPFNIDGVEPGSYKGISQIDPYWLAPILDNLAAGDPSAMDFYEPTWWTINGVQVHRTHLVIFRTEDLADILKPTYLYGAVSIPQKIYERVYAAERTANEAPMLALTKRTDVVTTDMSQALMNQVAFENRMALWVANRDNYGIKTIGVEEKLEQFDTSLSDLDAVIMTQYQLVAAAANVPATKLLGTTPKGFNATGEYEEASYHEELESIQEHHLTALLERHHLLLIKSKIAPEAGIEPFEVTISWNPLDAMTAEELANINKIKADTGQVLSASGAIDGEDERKRIIADPESGYSGLVDDEIATSPDDVIMPDKNDG